MNSQTEEVHRARPGRREWRVHNLSEPTSLLKRPRVQQPGALGALTFGFSWGPHVVGMTD